MLDHMLNSREGLGKLVKSHREEQRISQEQLALDCAAGINRSTIAHLEQGLRVPKSEVLEIICKRLAIPSTFWKPFTNPDSLQRFRFEEILGELVGHSVSLDGHDDATKGPPEEQVTKLFSKSFSPYQTQELFNSVLVFYGVLPVTNAFFSRYLGADAFSSVESLGRAVERYEREAVRLL